MDRRTMLKGGFALALASHTAVASGEVKPPEPFDLQTWLDKTDPEWVAHYHAARLAEVMNRIHPDKAYRYQIRQSTGAIQFIGDTRIV